MRQIFYEFPWVHAPASSAFLPLFQRYGHFERLKAGQAIYNGGIEGEVAWILSGLCVFQTGDTHDRPQFFTLVPANRLMGNVDGYTGAVVNITDIALRTTEVLLMSRHSFLSLIHRDLVLNDEHTTMLVREHESDMEGFFSAIHDRVEVRIARLFASLIFRDELRLTFNWNKAVANFVPTPIPYDLSITEIARTISATRTAVSLIMNDWLRAGVLVEKDGKRLITQALLSYANDWLASPGK